MLRLFDTARGEIAPLDLRDPGQVSMYVCGPTVYGPPHLGHGRFSLVFDVLRRYLEWSGYDVTYVSNITDVDDKIIELAHAEGRTEPEVAAQNEKLWWKAMDAIGVKRPTADPHATAYITAMVTFIEGLVASGVAYETTDGVYFQADQVADYGLLARQPIESLRAGARVQGSDEKRSPIDFALWKKAKPGEPSWPSPWGEGRPGWHTECVVMSLDLLGDGFDIHGGGQDLMFPHHENERAQAVATGHVSARHWVHNGFIEVDGEKMGKSLGNFTTLFDLVKNTDPRTFRLLVLRAHYRSPIEVNRNTTTDAATSLARLDTFARNTQDLPPAEPDPKALDRFRAAMDEDLNTPAAISLLFELVREGNTLLDYEDDAGAAAVAAAVRSICDAVGLVLNTESVDVPAEIIKLAKARDAARSAKDWATADAIRNQIHALGWIVEDSSGNTSVRKA